MWTLYRDTAWSRRRTGQTLTIIATEMLPENLRKGGKPASCERKTCRVVFRYFLHLVFFACLHVPICVFRNCVLVCFCFCFFFGFFTAFGGVRILFEVVLLFVTRLVMFALVLLFVCLFRFASCLLLLFYLISCVLCWISCCSFGGLLVLLFVCSFCCCLFVSIVFCFVLVSGYSAASQRFVYFVVLTFVCSVSVFLFVCCLQVSYFFCSSC